MSNISQFTIYQIQHLTRDNYHTLALVRLARALDEQFLVDQLYMIQMRSDANGYTSEADYQQRSDFKAWLMDKAAEVFDNFADIKAAF